MSNTLKLVFSTTPDTHADASGHWDRVEGFLPPPAGKAGDIAEGPQLRLQFQNGPVKEHGVNGCQLTDVLRIALARYKMLNKSFPCRENSIVITKLQEAIMWDGERTAKRTSQGVEGYDKPHADSGLA